MDWISTLKVINVVLFEKSLSLWNQECRVSASWYKSLPQIPSCDQSWNLLGPPTNRIFASWVNVSREQSIFFHNTWKHIQRLDYLFVFIGLHTPNAKFFSICWNFAHLVQPQPHFWNWSIYAVFFWVRVFSCLNSFCLKIGWCNFFYKFVVCTRVRRLDLATPVNFL